MGHDKIHDIRYAHEKFASAVEDIETHRDDIRDRLARAVTGFGPVTLDDLPEDAREDFKSIKRLLEGGGRHDPMMPGIKFPNMTDEGIADLSRLIHAVEAALRHYCEPN